MVQHSSSVFVLLFVAVVGRARAPAAVACPPGFVPHAPGFWQYSIPGPPGHPTSVDSVNNTAELCGRKCAAWRHPPCAAFKLSPDGNISHFCFIFPNPLQPPFVQMPPTVTTCVVEGYRPPRHHSVERPAATVFLGSARSGVP
eukprot:COSAG03_NODE_4363_length_1575_cov_1.626694_1_plen_142_part_10